MAKFGKIAVITQLESNQEDSKGFNMADDYGGQLRNATKDIQRIQEVEETVYGDENSQFSQPLPGPDNDINENNMRKNINFDPQFTSHHGLITPTSGMTEVGESNKPMNKNPSLTNLKPMYPGKRNSVSPMPLESHNLNQAVMKPINENSLQPNIDQHLNVRSEMIDKSMNDQSQLAEGKQLTQEDEESDEEDIIPEDEKWKTRKLFWQMNEQIRIKWDLFVMILAIWNCFSIPFNAAFKPDFMESITIEIFNSIIDLLFMVDVVINFRTSYINSKTGEEIFDLKMIAKNYLKGRFWVDIEGILY